MSSLLATVYGEVSPLAEIPALRCSAASSDDVESRSCQEYAQFLATTLVCARETMPVLAAPRKQKPVDASKVSITASILVLRTTLLTGHICGVQCSSSLRLFTTT